MRRMVSIAILSRPTSVVFLAIGAVILCVAVALLAGCRQERYERAGPFLRVRTTPEARAAQYVGDDACAACHPTAFKEHAASSHARTLRPMRRDRLPEGFPRVARFVDRKTGIDYTLEERYGRFSLTARAGSRAQTREIDFALGSGGRAMTFVSLDGPDALLELRLSYFPRRQEAFATPGQEDGSGGPMGARHTGKIGQRCLACHATVLPASRMAPEERFMGVGCEACHGPGKAHVEAARAGREARFMERLRTWGATRLNELCGECHRSARDINPADETMVSQTQRFQPYGLMKSACFLKSEDRLSCLTCHEPHRDVERRPAVYERVCRSCHGEEAQQTVCPVNAREGCVGCHMPTRELRPGIAMADHWIRVFRQATVETRSAP